MLKRRDLLAFSAMPLAAPAIAQDGYPSRPIRMIIPVGVGGVTDVVGRILCEALSPILGQPVVPENINGAGSTIGAATFERLPADGYSLFIGTNNHPIMKALRPEFAFDPTSAMSHRCSPGCAGRGMRRISARPIRGPPTIWRASC